ncbi:hypothetical protein CBR_g31270 [Chara braunii]|uniref:CCHC-type domain-containing protein n=1 Tax=Chara braunii TaxID=69332 RepID=A0A388JXX6_CHABU|nr:hypothetical protein CBR_g31270 [Chara braunii]|eukprot:GBG62635.1 hypothetical protein CBR_g31270 [Chara braunii]
MMPETSGASGAPKKGLTLDDLIAAIDRHERNPSNIPKVDTFHFCGERVSEWLERVEQALVGWSDVVKFQRILQYVLHSYHPEVKKVIDATQGSWERFKEGMQRKYRLGDGLLTTADLEAMNKEAFTTIGAFVQEFKKRARKVHGISEEVQCAIFLGLLTASETVELTRHRRGSTKLTWATIDRGVEVGCLDQVEQRQTQPMAPPPLPAPSSQGSVAGGGNQGQGNQGNGGRGGGRGRGRNGGGRGGQWNGQDRGNQGQGNQGQGYRGQGNQGQGDQGSQGYGRPRFDWRSAICQHCDQQGHTIRFCNIRREDEKSGLITSTMDGNIYDQLGEFIDKRLGGVRAEAQRRAAAGPLPPATFRLWQEKKGPSVGIEGFRLWQEKEEPLVGVEEVGSYEEVTQKSRGGSEGEEPIVTESDDEDEERRMEPSFVLLGKMEELLDKVGRYQQKLVALCEEVREWKSSIPKVFLYDSDPESTLGRAGVNVVGSSPQPGVMGRPLTRQARLAQAARIRNQAKASASQEPPRREPEPGRRKEVVEMEDDDDEEEEDERLRREEDQRAEQRARKKGTRGEAESVIRDGPPKKKKYAVRLEEGFDVEKVIDRLLEGHNDFMTLKEILASAPRLRDELKGRLSRRLVSNVHLGTILPKETEWAESGTKMDWKCVVCGTVDLVVKGSKCAAMVDTGAEKNIIREADAIKFGLDIDRSDCGILHGASCKAVFCGTVSNVLIEVEKESPDQSGSLNPAGNVDEVSESQDDEFEEGEIKEAFRAEEYDGIYLELRLLLSYEIRLRDASARAQRMLQRYLVRDGHLFVRREWGIPGASFAVGIVISTLWQRFTMALQEGIEGSDFPKTVMPRGGRGTRPPRRALGASGGYERYGPHHRESTPVYDDGDIELFLDSFWDHARRMSWTVAHAIERLRGAGKFEEPVARIRREATTRSEVEWRMQELRPSPVGPDGRPIRLEIGNASDFIPAFEWFMQGQGIPRDDWMQTLPLWTRKAERPLASQVRDMARDWESCKAHLREAFRRPEPPQPRVERRQRSQRQRDPETREVRPSRVGRKALARRETEPEPEVEERGAYPECGLGPVEFLRFTAGGLRRRSPARAQEEPSASEGPLRDWRRIWISLGGGRRLGVRNLEEPAPAEPRKEPCRPEKEMEAEIPKRVDLRTRERASVGETAEEKRARRTRRIDEIWQERQRLEAAWELPEQQQERQRSEAAGALPGKKMKEVGHGVRLEAMEVEIQELRALVASQAAIIESLRQQSQGEVDKPESSQQGEQRQAGHESTEQPAAEQPRQRSPMGRVIMEPEEAEAKREAERRAFEFRTPTELSTLPIMPAEPVLPIPVEEVLPAISSGPAQGSAGESMDVLLEAIDTMQEEASLFSPEQRLDELLESALRFETRDAAEGRPQRLDPPEYRPEGVGIRSQSSTQELERKPEGPSDLPLSFELSREASEAPSSPGSQMGKKKGKKRHDDSCFYCKKEGHRAWDCPKFQKNEADGKVTRRNGKMYDRQGRVVERSQDGGRAQLYRQNQEEMSE